MVVKQLRLELLLVLSLLGSCQSTQRKRNSLDLKDNNNCRNDSDCPTWFTCDSHNETCVCGNGHSDIVVCDKYRLISAVLDCNCVTYDKGTQSTFAGLCFYNCENHHSQNLVTTLLPKRAEMLSNSSICNHFNRAGLLCGDCKEGHSPLVLSYNLSCVKCPDGHKNWWKFILAGFVPLTVFYFFAVLFNINVTSSRLHGVVWFSQALSIPVFVRMVMSVLTQGYPRLMKTVKILTIFYSYWNLEVLRSVLPDICLNITTLQALALEYLIALYPFVLILISYFIIQLYDKKCSLVVILWKPFHKVLSIFRNTWDIRTSVIDSFATFILLSYMKILSVTTDLLAPTQIYKLGSNRSTFGLYYSPSVEYFGNDHLPYAILAIIILTCFVLVPILISFLYPFRCFQNFLSLFPFNWHFLHAFVDSFQGCYKDGTEPGTLDCRWFSALTLFIRPLLLVAHITSLSTMTFVYSPIIVVLSLIVLINIQPFKKVAVRYPSTDPIFLILLSIFYIAVLGRTIASINNFYFATLTALLLVAALVPIFYIASLICYWLFSRRQWINALVNRFR